ncbi:MAG: DNA-binding protein [Epsilonproteobacteria bacterium]|nr:MAG: DNA-binding protein [Campylobacterota bacterium]
MKIIFLIAFIIIGGFTYMKLNPIEPIIQQSFKEDTFTEKSVINPVKKTKKIPHISNKSYQCDGRIHCSQMHSCEEAKFFIRNCRGTKMDGDNDGVPCESQWCH